MKADVATRTRDDDASLQVTAQDRDISRLYFGESESVQSFFRFAKSRSVSFPERIPGYYLSHWQWITARNDHF